MLITSRNRNIRTGESVVYGFQNDENGRSQMIPALQTKDGKIHGVIRQHYEAQLAQIQEAA